MRVKLASKNEGGSLQMSFVVFELLLKIERLIELSDISSPIKIESFFHEPLADVWAKEELKRLLEQLKQIENAVVPSEHPNIESRLSEISKQHQTLNNEEQVVSKLQSSNDDDKVRDDAEYESIKNKIKEAKEEYSIL